MTTERMLMIAAAAMVCATCCAKEDYKDPQKFAEKYVREDIENRYPGKMRIAPEKEPTFLYDAKGILKKDLMAAIGEIVENIMPLTSDHSS